MDIYNNSSTQEKILSFQKTTDLKLLISNIRLTTTITKNSVNVNICIGIYILFLYYVLHNFFLLVYFYTVRESIC